MSRREQILEMLGSVAIVALLLLAGFVERGMS